MDYVFPWFVNPCIEAFGFLVTRYGFDVPVIEQLGRECFIWYRKDNRWVSIAYEPGSIPIVELFYPAHDIKYRRIPRLNIGIERPRQFSGDEQHQRQTLQSQAEDLEIKEKAFLTGT